MKKLFCAVMLLLMGIVGSVSFAKVLYVGTNAEFQPFEYLEDGKIVGFGDIIKVIDILSKRPQIQERLGAQIADAIYETLNCQGVMIIIKAKQYVHDYERRKESKQ